MATKNIHHQPCAGCGGPQVQVTLEEPGETNSWYTWRVKLPDRGMFEALQDKYISDASPYVCSSCGRITMYVDDLANLLHPDE